MSHRLPGPPQRKAAGPAGVPCLSAGGRKPATGLQRKGGEERSGLAALNLLALVSALGWWGGWGASGLGQQSWGEARCHPRLVGVGEPEMPRSSRFSHSSPGVPVLHLSLGFPVFVGVRILKIRVCVKGAQAGVGACERSSALPGYFPGAHAKGR